tara:strand:+ start:6751 stop:6894 length:144 start_codon:yes stop_codon:yes gene_type:complete
LIAAPPKVLAAAQVHAVVVPSAMAPLFAVIGMNPGGDDLKLEAQNAV